MISGCLSRKITPVKPWLEPLSNSESPAPPFRTSHCASPRCRGRINPARQPNESSTASYSASIDFLNGDHEIAIASLRILLQTLFRNRKLFERSAKAALNLPLSARPEVRRRIATGFPSSTRACAWSLPANSATSVFAAADPRSWQDPSTPRRVAAAFSMFGLVEAGTNERLGDVESGRASQLADRAFDAFELNYGSDALFQADGGWRDTRDR